jgi:hypothetical protein
MHSDRAFHIYMALMVVGTFMAVNLAYLLSGLPYLFGVSWASAAGELTVGLIARHYTAIGLPHRWSLTS